MTADADIHALSDSFLLNMVLNNLIYFAVMIWDYYTVAWYSIMYVPGWPVFVIWAWWEEWDLTKVPYQPTLDDIGLESL